MATNQSIHDQRSESTSKSNEHAHLSVARFTSAKEASDGLHRAVCIIGFAEQAFRHAQFEEPFCSTAISETLSVAYEIMCDLQGFIDALRERGAFDAFQAKTEERTNA